MWANVLATVVAAFLTGCFGYFTARLTMRVQAQAQATQAHSGESERAWKRAEKGDADADKWRVAWAAELEKRVRLEAENTLLKGRVEALQKEQNL
jgi:hypothetical protein